MHTTQHCKVLWGAGSLGAATKVGHTMVLPVRHVSQLGELAADEALDLLRTVCLVTRSVYKAWFEASSWPTHNIGPQASCNIGFNYGPHGSDSVGLPGRDHLHVHVVPRNPNDTNFMWWTTQGSILHLKDLPVREAFVASLQLPHGEPGEAADNARAEGSSASRPVPEFGGEHPLQSECPLCREDDSLLDSEHGKVLFSTKPYKYGHVMVIPKRHVATLERCTDAELTDLSTLITRSAETACRSTGADSYSVGINGGPHSGASIPSHLHIHVVPRYPRDCSVAYWPAAAQQHGRFEKPEHVRAAFEQQRHGAT